MKAEVDGEASWSPTVWVAYALNRKTPAIPPTRQRSRRSSPCDRAMAIANGPSASTAIVNRSNRYANGVTSSSARPTRGNVTPKSAAATTNDPSAANREVMPFT